MLTCTPACAHTRSNGDGLIDVFVGQHQRVNQIHKNMGGGVFTEVLSTSIHADTGSDTRGIALADFDLDGRLDVAISNINCDDGSCFGRTELHRNIGDDNFERVTRTSIDAETGQLYMPYPQSKWAGWADIDNDGYPGKPHTKPSNARPARSCAHVHALTNAHDACTRARSHGCARCVLLAPQTSSSAGACITTLAV